MPAVDKLRLEDALQDSPQTRSLLSVFEEDAGTLTEYTNQLLQAMQRVYGAQNEMCLATQQLSKHLLAYEKQNFALGKGDEEVISTLQSFSKIVDELNVLHTELAKQLADTMVLPVIQFREKDLTVSTLKDLFSLASNEHDISMARYSRLPKKKENGKLKAEVAKEVASARRKQHLSSLQYYCALNALQYRKRIAMMEPMLGYAHSQINFLKKGAERFSKKLDGFLTSVTNTVQSIQEESDAEIEAMRVSQQDLLSVGESVYTPDFDASPVINKNLIQKAGYLNLRNKTGLVTTTWDRLYFFTQGGNLMCQPRGAVAGGLIQDLDNCSVMAIDCEDRRYCFQITTPTGKPGITLQAESKKEYEEWISAINNISRQIYLTDNPEAVAIRLNQTALQAVTPITSFETKQAGHPSSQDGRCMDILNDQTVPEESAEALIPMELIAPGTPIQFDIVLPATEFLDQHRGGRRTNPFGESEDGEKEDETDSLLQHMFVVRFLGSMAVRSDHTVEVIYEAMRQVLAARAIHNIFRTTESHLLVTSNDLKLIDPQTQVTRSNFELANVTQFAAHKENKRLFGFVVCVSELSGEDGMSAYVFESNTEGEKICYTINLGKEIIEARKDPKALAQLISSMPLTNDGKFKLLNEQSEEDNAVHGEEQESEA
ncbi:DCC-interacting protein 13-beta isoform X2 [Thamnophis elegans]|uniref:DCC-interacting protein 13-beta isoform X2 n=1 Tax=Thamnophis elegans TaxID=35005 RepID=UPI00137761D4|nr:DCC-interacting protein 13-beta isoform X2 [Thamnophis elegans]